VWAEVIHRFVVSADEAMIAAALEAKIKVRRI